MKKKILVAPLNWGLGHATRCIPIINALINYGFEPIIASDGEALSLLQKEFPYLTFFELPSYKIEYAQKGKNFKYKLLKDSPKLLKAIKQEKKVVKKIINEVQIAGVISDNRLGVYNKKIPSVFITHQLNVLSGSTTWLSTKLHQNSIKNFNECWIPDNLDSDNLSGKLGHSESFNVDKKYIGPLSRLKKVNSEIVFDVLVLISGPEPQRSFLEKKLMEEFKTYNGKVAFVKGVMEKTQHIETVGNMMVYNFMTSEGLEKTINESSLIVSRSGYTTLMDLAKLEKKAFFIPTPGQFEQEYLAKRCTELNFAPHCNQDDFKIEKLKTVDSYKGLSSSEYEVNFKKLFRLF